jgi:antitoxin YefM
MQVTTIQNAKKNLEQLICQVDTDAEPIMIFLDESHKAVLLSEREFTAWQETEYLLSNPANATHLRKSLEQACAGQVAERELVEI